jgi:hypothetical protein
VVPFHAVKTALISGSTGSLRLSIVSRKTLATHCATSVPAPDDLPAHLQFHAGKALDLGYPATARDMF